MRTEAGLAEIDHATALVEQALGELPQGPTAYEQFMSGAYNHEPSRYIDLNALVGRCNPAAPPMRVRFEDGFSLCELTLDDRYVGAPGMAHGGAIAACFDQIAGHCVVMNGYSGFTIKLEVRYRKKTPLYRPLVWRGRLTHVDARRMEATATCTLDGVVLTECDARFARLAPERAREVIRGE
jgi:acyl-coenzyme A thioesterase PaaI-like protein